MSLFDAATVLVNLCYCFTYFLIHHIKLSWRCSCLLVSCNTHIIIGEKLDVSMDGIADHIHTLLETIQSSLFQRAKEGRDSKIVTVTKWADFVPALNRACMVMTPFCDNAEWEDKVKVSPVNRSEDNAAVECIYLHCWPSVLPARLSICLFTVIAVQW